MLAKKHKQTPLVISPEQVDGICSRLNEYLGDLGCSADDRKAIRARMEKGFSNGTSEYFRINRRFRVELRSAAARTPTELFAVVNATDETQGAYDPIAMGYARDLNRIGVEVLGVPSASASGATEISASVH
ncbi:hypothetical protein HYV73_02815 [Candidatus Uhrbacteria bacterium]|nr:hypothetical protein [Candidatus Uhrbacteria bacterium]